MKLFVVILVLGFPAALVFSWAFEITPQGVVRESVAEAGKSITRRTGRKIVAVTVVLAIIATGLLVFQVLRARSTMTARSVSDELRRDKQSATATPILQKSIAVLPFDNLSEDK